MRRALISTTSLALSLVLAGAGAGTAMAAESPSPSPSPSVSVSPTPSPSPSVSEPDPETGGEPDDEVAALEYTGLDVPTYTCDTDPTDDFALPADTDGVTYTLEDGVFVATPNEGYQWVDWYFSDPWVDPAFSNFGPGFRIPEVGPTEPIAIPVADMAYPNCNHDDETTVDLSTECVDGLGYLVYDIDAWWATEDTTVRIYPYTKDEAIRGHIVYEGTELSGRLAWDGSSPGMTSEIGPIGSGVNLPDVDAPIFSLSTGGPEKHAAIVKADFSADDPCLDAAPGDGESGGGSAGADDEELAATGPEAAWLTAGVAALLVAAGAALVVARRRMRA
ncbi:hypothetical protein [Promicromonospora sukumoe]|uniref:LPXTG-motif cell wall-anchored protein n=1 Tax=Promicromonospora sukumoe TaxID=88382 RepID=A0A7W3JBX3_9MICO|nr:hypothetical protein [Promicromonospora sukumoe]MBA8810002.1 hypothetical protein [Promicromonospora sukumoe]